ncbi:uncharacterized protein LOC144605225 [Rhinoraja longicauda]
MLELKRTKIQRRGRVGKTKHRSKTKRDDQCQDLELLTILLGLVTAALLALEHQGAWNFVKSVFHFRFSFLEHHKTTSVHLSNSSEGFIPTVAMNKNQLNPVPQTAFTPKPSSSLSSGGEQVHSSVASPASGLAASPSPATGLTIVHSVSCPGTYIQIPINAEVWCVSTFSLPPIVQKKIYGGICNVPKSCNNSKSTTAIYICPVNPIKLTEEKCLVPLVHKPLQSDSGAQSVTDSEEKPISSLAAKVTSKETSSRRQDKMNWAGKEGIVTPTPVSVRFCNNLASEVLKTYVKQQGKQNSMEELMKTYFNKPLHFKTASSFKDNALLLFNGQLFFLAHKGIDIPIGSDKGKLLAKESGTNKSKVVQGGPGKQRVDTGQTSTSSSGLGRDTDSSESKCELKTDRKECAAKGDATAITLQNGLELAQQVVKRLPNSLPGSCVKRLTFSENRDLLLKAGIHSEVRVCLYRISMNGKTNASGHQLERPIKCIPQFSKTPELVNLEECPKLSRETELAKLKECPEIIRECDPPELKECPKLSREVEFGDLEEISDTSKVPSPYPSQECPELSKESGPVVMEECAAISRVPKSVRLEGCPRISRDGSPVTLEELHGYSKSNVSVALQDDGDTHIIPKSADVREHLKPTVNLGSADLKDCLPESDEECHSKCRRKRKEVFHFSDSLAKQQLEVEIEIRSSGCVNPNLDNDKSATNKRRKHNEASESPRETCGLPNVGRRKNAEAAPIPPCSLLELNKEQSEYLSQDGFQLPEQENPLEVDETVRDEKINRLKEILKEKQAALECMRKKVSPSSSESCSVLEPL